MFYNEKVFKIKNKYTNEELEKLQKQKRYKKRFIPTLLLVFLALLGIGLSVFAFFYFNDAHKKNGANENSLVLENQLTKTETKENTTTKPTIPEIVSTAKIVSTGDLLMHGPILTNNYNASNDSYNFDSLFSQVGEYVKNADLAVADLEGTLGGNENGRQYSGYPSFNAPDALIDSVKKAGFDMLLTANNHSYDSGFDGFMRTQKVLKNKDLLHIGTRPDKNDNPYIIKDLNGIKVGLMNYTYEFGEPRENRKQVLLNGIPLNEEASQLVSSFHYDHLDEFYNEIKENIKKMKSEDVNAVVMYIHWGDEYMLEANQKQREIAQKLCDIGVDVIIGGHPHVIQPIEHFKSDISGKNTVCIYSLGNAVSNQRIDRMDMKSGHTEDGVLFGVTLSLYSDGTTEVTNIEAIPTWVNLHSANGKQVYEILPLDKNVSWDTFKNLSNKTGAENSYNRTIKLLGEGVNSFKPYKIKD